MIQETIKSHFILEAATGHGDQILVCRIPYDVATGAVLDSPLAVDICLDIASDPDPLPQFGPISGWQGRVIVDNIGALLLAIGLLDQHRVVTVIGDDAELQQAGLGDSFLDLGNFTILGIGDNDLNLAAAIAAQHHLTRAAWIDTATECLDHGIHRWSFTATIVFQLVDQVDAPLEVDAVLEIERGNFHDRDTDRGQDQGNLPGVFRRANAIDDHAAHDVGKADDHDKHAEGPETLVRRRCIAFRLNNRKVGKAQQQPSKDRHGEDKAEGISAHVQQLGDRRRQPG